MRLLLRWVLRLSDPGEVVVDVSIDPPALGADRGFQPSFELCDPGLETTLEPGDPLLELAGFAFRGTAHEGTLPRPPAVRASDVCLIRDVLDAYLGLGTSEEERLAAFRAVREAFGAAPYLLDGASFVRAVRRPDVQRQEALERRRGT